MTLDYSKNIIQSKGTLQSLAADSVPYDAQIEYIQSSGTQLIDTGIVPTTSLVITADLMPLERTSYILFGCVQQDYSIRYRFFNPVNEGGIYFDFDAGRINTASISTDLVNVRAVIEVGNYYIKKDGIQLVSSTKRTSASDTLPIFIFGGPFQTRTAYAKMRLYSFKMQDGDIVLRDFIPVRVGDAGYLYDKVSGELFENCRTGKFILGPDIR